MNEKRMDRILIPMLCSVVIIVTLFSFWLNYLKFGNIIKVSKASLIYTVSTPYVEKIEYAIKFGKPINKFFGIQAIMAENQTKEETIQKIAVFYPSKSVLYSTNENESSTFKTNKSITSADKETKYVFSEGDETYDILIPIKNAQSDLLAIYGVSIDKNCIDKPITAFMKSSLSYIAILIFIGCIIIAKYINILCRKLKKLDYKTKSLAKLVKIDAIVIATVVIVIVQLIVTMPMLLTYEKMYQVTIKSTATMLGAAIYDQVREVVVDKGVKYKDIHNLQGWIDDYKSEIEQVESVSLTLPNISYDAKYLYEQKLPIDADREERTLYVLTSQKYLSLKKQEVIRDAVTIFIISIIILIESMKYIQTALSVQRKHFSNITEKSININFSRLRIFAFVFAAVGQLPVSFIPIIAAKVYSGEQGMHMQFLTGLSVSLYIAGLILSTQIAKVYRKWVKWTNALEIGLFIMASGLCLSAFCDNIHWFLGARLVDGYGYGMAWMALKTALKNERDEKVRDKVFNEINLGLLAGINCAAAIGAMLFDRLGYRSIFLIAGIGILVLSFIAKLILKPIPIPLEETHFREELKKRSFLNLKVIVFMILIALPSALFIMFLKYYFPLYASSQSFSQSDIGRTFLIYGVIVLYAAPALSKVMRDKVGLKLSTYIAFAVTALGLILFAVWPGIKTAIVVIIVMALMDSFREKIESQYFTQMEEVQEIGYVKAVGKYNGIKSLGQTLGPIAFALGSYFGLTNGVGVIGIVSVGMFILYIIYTIWTSNKKNISYNGKGEWF